MHEKHQRAQRHHHNQRGRTIEQTHTSVIRITTTPISSRWAVEIRRGFTHSSAVVQTATGFREASTTTHYEEVDLRRR